MKGIFITFEGSEGCGKSTQSKLLCDYLKKKGYAVLHLREPGGTAISEQIRRILLDVRHKEMVPECEMLLYMAARAQIVNEVIRPALQKGTIVISDRFLDSTLAYQGYGLGMSLSFIKQVGMFVTRGRMPDVTIFLDLSVRKGLDNRQYAQDRIEKRTIRYHQKVRRGYLKLAEQEPQRIKIIKVNSDKYKTQEKIRELIDASLDK